jgi:hypothetical protein
MGGKPATDEELHPLNGDLFDFDLASVSVEELERRFEMALAVVVEGPPSNCSCPELVSCGTFCIRPPV